MSPISTKARSAFGGPGKYPDGLDYGMEVARQFGSLGSDSIGAWAGHWIAGYTFGKARFTPRAFVEYNYASGDNNATDGHRGTFDQLYPSGHDLYGLADQVGWKNIRHLRTGLEIKPKPVWSLSARYSSYWLANSHDALYAASSAVVAKSTTGDDGDFRWPGIGLRHHLQISQASLVLRRLRPLVSGHIPEKYIACCLLHLSLRNAHLRFLNRSTDAGSLSEGPHVERADHHRFARRYSVLAGRSSGVPQGIPLLMLRKRLHYWSVSFSRSPEVSESALWRPAHLSPLECSG